MSSSDPKDRDLHLHLTKGKLEEPGHVCVCVCRYVCACLCVYGVCLSVRGVCVHVCIRLCGVLNVCVCVCVCVCRVGEMGQGTAAPADSPGN